MIGENIGANLKALLPRKIASDRLNEDNVLTIEVKRNGLGGSIFALMPHLLLR